MFKFWQDQKCRIGAFSSRIGTPAGRHGLALRPNGHPPTTHPLKLQVFDWRREQRTFPWNCGCFGKQSALSKPVDAWAKVVRTGQCGRRSCVQYPILQWMLSRPSPFRSEPDRLFHPAIGAGPLYLLLSLLHANHPRIASCGAGLPPHIACFTLRKGNG